jgi:hypothetical protein
MDWVARPLSISLSIVNKIAAREAGSELRRSLSTGTGMHQFDNSLLVAVVAAPRVTRRRSGHLIMSMDAIRMRLVVTHPVLP